MSKPNILLVKTINGNINKFLFIYKCQQNHM